MTTRSTSGTVSVAIRRSNRRRPGRPSGKRETATVSQVVRHHAHIRTALIFTALLVFAAVGPLPSQAGPDAHPAWLAGRAQPGANATALLKPMIPPDGNQSVDANKPAVTTGQKPPAGPERRIRMSGRSQEDRWEDRKVRNAARDIAKGLPSVKKIQICYVVEADEWWVSLYDDIGTDIDIRQFIWNREQESLEPFLVLNRIPKSRLDAQLSKKTPDRACETLDSNALSKR